MTRRVHRAARTTTIAVLLAASVAPGALAAHNSLGDHQVASSHGANVRRAASNGSRTNQYIGHLKKGESFSVTKHDGSFCFGHAGGHVKHDGWVLCGALSS